MIMTTPLLFPFPSSRQDQIPLAIRKSLSAQLMISLIGSGDRFSTFFRFNGVMPVTSMRDNSHNSGQILLLSSLARSFQQASYLITKRLRSKDIATNSETESGKRLLPSRRESF
jgi:hypothetical protein